MRRIGIIGLGSPSCLHAHGNRRSCHVSSAPEQLLSLLRRCTTPSHLYQTHGFMLPRALDHDNLLLTRFLHVCSSLDLSGYALSLFACKPNPDICLFNTMIRALSRSPSPARAFLLFDSIRYAGLRPDSYSFPFVLKAVVRLRALELGRALHCQTIPTGLHFHVHVLTAFVQMYSSCGCLSDARKLFHSVISIYSDVVLWNAMLAAYVKAGELDHARQLFERMPQRNIISWTAVIAGYSQANCPEEAIALFRRMQLQNVKPDEVALLAALSACAHLGALQLGEWICDYIDKHGLRRIIPVNNALIDMYAKWGNIIKALEVFHKMDTRTVVTWTTMISGLALHGLARDAIDMFSQMERAGAKPNEVTFTAILSACSHVGMVDEGWWFFINMEPRYGIKPKIEHYGCIIDLIARAGYLTEAQELVRLMPFKANAAIWGSLLAAANAYADAQLGECALQHLIKLEPQNSGNYALLSNIYAACSRWNDSRLVRKLMREVGVRKVPGGSTIEVNNKVNEFVAGEVSHPQLDSLHKILRSIDAHLKHFKVSTKRMQQNPEVREPIF